MTDDSILGDTPKNSERPLGSGGFGGPADATGGLAFRGTPASHNSAEQLAYQRGQQDMLRRITTPRMTGWRIACGICWAFWTVSGPGAAGDQWGRPGGETLATRAEGTGANLSK